MKLIYGRDKTGIFQFRAVVFAAESTKARESSYKTRYINFISALIKKKSEKRH